MSDGDVGFYRLALGLALRARIGEATGNQVAGLLIHARKMPADDPILLAVLVFAAGYARHRRDPAAVTLLGEALGRAIDIATRVPDTFVAVGADRKDIHG